VTIYPNFYEETRVKTFHFTKQERYREKKAREGRKGLERRNLKRVKNIGAKVRLRLGFWN